MFTAKRSVPISGKDLTSFVLDNPRYDQDKPIYIDAADGRRCYSHRKAKRAIKKLVAGFHALGLEQGDCVLINSMADIDYSILFHGIIAAGGIFCGANPFYTPQELAHQIQKTKPKYIFTESEFLPRICPVANQCGVPQDRIFSFDHQLQQPTMPEGIKSWTALLHYGEKEWNRFDDETTGKKVPAAYVMSSGTTGLPKAVVISHFNFVAAQTLAFDAEDKRFEVKRLLCLPQYATAAIYSNHICPLRGGEVAYVMPRFVPSAFLDNIERFQISELTFMPPMITKILQHPRFSKERLKSVRYAHGGGAPISKSLQAELKQYLPSQTPFTQVYGMSETSGHTMCLFWPEDDKTGSIGRPISNVSLKLIDDNGMDVTAYDVRGELCVRGPTVMVGYLENAPANAVTFDHDGWLKTGDICYCNSKTQKWYIVDRKKDLIKVNGFQVAPPELEGILLQHPGIADAAVVGVDFPVQATELPVAYIVRQSGHEQLTEEEVKGYVEVKVAKYKRLEGGVFFVDDIPKSPIGKILKGILREKAKHDVKARRSNL